MSETIQRYRFPTTPAMNWYGMEASADGKWVRYEDHAAEIARLTRELEEARARKNHALARLDASRAEAARLREELEELGAAMDRAAEEGFKIAARLTARVEEAEARAVRAEREREEAREDVVKAAGELLVSVPAPGTDLARCLSANSIMRRERDAARAELAEARTEVTRLREAGKQFAEEIEHGCLACCGDGCEGAHVDDTREAIATFRRALGGEA
jgi:DNA repair exonuclease SbcCD ATPase subunit